MRILALDGGGIRWLAFIESIEQIQRTVIRSQT